MRSPYRFSLALYRALLLILLPSGVRQEAGDELEVVFLHCINSWRQRWGVIGHGFALIRSTFDLAFFAFDAHRRWSEPPTPTWDAMAQDLRDAARSVRRTPGVSFAIVAILALGIGANATMFAVVDRVLLSPPRHVVDADQVKLVHLHRADVNLSRVTRNLAYPDILDLRDVSALDAIASYATPQLWTLGLGPNARKVRVQLAEAAFFSTLGVRPFVGRFYSSDEDEPGAPLKAVLSHEFWMRELAGDASALGRILELNRGRYEVIGIAPQGFTGAELRPVDLWLPLRAAMASEARATVGDQVTGLRSRTWYWAKAVVRLRPSVPAQAAEAAMTTRHVAARRIFEANGGERSLHRQKPRLTTSSIIGAGDERTALTSRVSAWLAGVSAIVLIMACANVANLLLSRGIRARRELAVRVALGATRTRLMRLVIAEAALLATGGGIAAFILAAWATAIVRSLLPDVAFGDTILDTRMIVFNLAAAIVTVFLAGILPAIQAGRAAGSDAIRTVSRGNSPSRSRLRDGLMVAQITLAVVLLVGAGLFAQSFWTAAAEDLGFDHERTVVARIEEDTSTTPRRRAQLYREALPRVSGLPGVQSAALATATIALGGYSSLEGLAVPGVDSIPELPGGGPYLYSGTQDFFATLGVEITRGREFAPAEFGDGAEPVGMVNDTFARRIWPGQDPMGRCFTLIASDSPDTPVPCRRVVGVFRDVARFGLAEGDALSVAVPTLASSRNVQGLVVRVKGDPADLIASLRHAIASTSPDVRFVQIDTMAERFDGLLEPWRLGATMFGAFGVVALLVAALGLYSTLSFGVAQRQREIGVRSALGASRPRIIGMVVGDATRLVAAGLLLGTVLALASGRFIDSLLFGVASTDLSVYGVVMLTLAVAGLIAAFVPAWLATRVCPIAALESE